MHETSSVYRELLAGDHYMETRLTVGESGRLVDERGNTISFGGTNILVASSGAESGFDERALLELSTSQCTFSKDSPSIGDCISGEIDVYMLRPLGSLPRQARMVPYVRLSNGTVHSEWIQKGVYYIDTREFEDSYESVDKIRIHGYDDMLKTEQDYPSSTLSWPATDVEVVREIARFIDVQVDQRTIDIMVSGYKVGYPAGYSCREVLGYIATMYAGCFVMSDLGELRLIQLAGIPKESRNLTDEVGNYITFGGDRIRV